MIDGLCRLLGFLILRVRAGRIGTTGDETQRKHTRYEQEHYFFHENFLLLYLNLTVCTLLV